MYYYYFRFVRQCQQNVIHHVRFRTNCPHSAFAFTLKKNGIGFAVSPYLDRDEMPQQQVHNETTDGGRLARSQCILYLQSKISINCQTACLPKHKLLQSSDSTVYVFKSS